MTTTISAILPNYNSVEFLPKSIQSLIDQTEAFSEIIIVDDGSTDHSLSVIQAFMEKHPHIRLVKHEKNQGVCQALNTGIKAATGDYVILCAADDWYDRQIVALAKTAVRQAPNVGLVCGDAVVHRFDKASSFLRTLPYAKQTPITATAFKTIAKQHYVGFNGGGGMLINREAILNAQLLHPALRWHCDWLLYFVVAFQQGIYYTDAVFVYINMRREGYAEGKRQWKVQKQVMLDTVQVMQQHYPRLWNHFKEAALLPHYSIKYLPLFLFYPTMRRFFTKQLLWKLVINNGMVVRIGRLFPYRIILTMRKLLKA